jgi:hypothetical protein
MKAVTGWSLLGAGVITLAAACADPTGMSHAHATATAAGDQSDLVMTPAGLLHRSCVHEVANGASISKTGVVTNADGSVYTLPPCLFETRANPFRIETSSPTDSSYIEEGSVAATGTNGYSEITANWPVPPAPLAAYAGTQVYFAFPALQSNTPFIVQPVLQYGASAAGSGNLWLAASWHCPSSGSCNHTSGYKVTSGHTMHGSVVASNCSNGDCTWTITSEDMTSGIQTSLTVVDSNNYQLALGGAVEVYGLTSCDQFPANGVSFSSISLLNHRSMALTPAWSPAVQSNTSPSCGFGVTSTASSVNLAHNAQSLTASGGVTAHAPGSCTPPSCVPNAFIVSMVATGGSTIAVKDNWGNTGTIALHGMTASGGLTANVGSCVPSIGVTCPAAGIISEVATGATGIVIKDNYGHSGSISLSGGSASLGLVAQQVGCSPTSGCATAMITADTASGGNGIILADNFGHREYLAFGP